MVVKPKERLTRERWLAEGLEILAAEGAAALSLNKLIERFHVTKGSFYWHFENLAAFQEALVGYWDERFTRSVPNIIDESSGDAAQRLWHLLQFVVKNELSGYDAVMSTLAMRTPALRPAVDASFQFRLRYVRKQFAAIGYGGREATIRAKIFVAFAAAEPGINAMLTKKQRLAQLPETWKILVPGIEVSA